MSDVEEEKPQRDVELTTDRLILRRFPWNEVGAIVEGRRLDGWTDDYPTEGDVVIAGILTTAGPDSVGPDVAWGHWQVLERSSGLVVGGIGFLGLPVEGTLEVGYGMVPSCHGRGYATEALRTVVAFASTSAGDVVKAIVAGTDDDNGASQRVLDKVGFRFVERTDVLRYRLDL